MYVLFVLSAVCCSRVLDATAVEYLLNEAEKYFEDFMQQYSRQYTEDKKETRFEIFKDNLAELNRLNEESEHAVFGITRFADLTLDEFNNMHTGLLMSDDVGCQIIPEEDVPDANAPESWDWRTQNMVTDVKDQGTCKSCYAFASTGHLESQYAMKYNKNVSLSEQQIVDCVNKTYGCEGGFPGYVFRFIIETGGIESDIDYPYQDRKDTCAFDKNKAKVTLTGCHIYRLTSQDKLKQLLYKKGPIIIGVCANYLRHYTEGIIGHDKCTTGGINHAALLIGYGTENDKPYWIVKTHGVQIGQSLDTFVWNAVKKNNSVV